MRLHRNIAEAIIGILNTVFNKGEYAEAVVQHVLQSNRKWGARDRKLIAEAAYDIIRWRLFLSAVAETGPDDGWGMLGAWCVEQHIAIPSWEEFNRIDVSRAQNRLQQPYPYPIRQSTPEWIHNMGIEELGARWPQELEALNQPAPVTLRVNTLQGSISWVRKQLALELVETAPTTLEGCLEVSSQGRRLTQTQAFQRGYFEIQDRSSQHVAPFLQVESGMTVIDACAGAGGKTLHLAALMKDQGKIIALDTDAEKLMELGRRAQRAGVRAIKPHVIRSPKTIRRWRHTADRLLLDVPCSSIGSMRRHPDLKWRLHPAAMEVARRQQRMILNQYISMLKPGGMALYATCSIFPSENERQVGALLANKSSALELVAEKVLWPSGGGDGFYMALIKKIGATD